VQQGMRHEVGRGGHEHGGAFHARGRRDLDALHEQIERQGILREAVHEERATALPRGEQREDHRAHHQREPPSRGNLERVGGEERDVDQHERRGNGERGP